MLVRRLFSSQIGLYLDAQLKRLLLSKEAPNKKLHILNKDIQSEVQVKTDEVEKLITSKQNCQP